MMQKTLRLLRAFFRQAGYRPYRMSRFENYELYADKKDFLVSDRVVAFSDTDGSLKALKPDVTLSIVKSAELEPGEKKKLYYQENVYRPAGIHMPVREIMQCGIECLGSLEASDYSEVMNLAELSLRLISEDSLLCFSHLGVFNSLSSKLGADEADQKSLLELISARNLHEMSTLFEQRNWDTEVLGDVKSLLRLNCSLSNLKEALENYPWIDPTVLEEVSALRISERSRFDFSILNDTHYYNGLVFQVFIRGVSEKLLAGGRYDRLMARMGRKGSAMGFAIYLDLLPKEEAKQDVLVLYDEKTDPEVFQKTVFALQHQGKIVSVQCSSEMMDIRGGNRNA